jgi:hypothetical protein
MVARCTGPHRSVAPREGQAALSVPSTGTCSDPCGVRWTFLTELMAVNARFAQAIDISARV